MAVKFVVTCGDCQAELDLPVAQVSLVTTNSTTTYGFECICCRAHTVRVASSSTLSVLADHGIVPRVVPLSEPQVAGEPPAGPPLTEDDLIAFGMAIEALG